MDNPFVIPTAGQADWDTSLNTDLNTVERGYHITERAGTAINTGQVLFLNSGGFFFPYNPNSVSEHPHAMAYTAAASGDSLTALAWGIVRSLGINSVVFPGISLFVSVLTPGLICTTPNGTRKIGVGLSGYGVLFDPTRHQSVVGLLDVNTAGLALGSFLQWSNTTSTFAVLPYIGAGNYTASKDFAQPGMAAWINPSDQRISPFDPNSTTIFPDGITATSVGAGGAVIIFHGGKVLDLTLGGGVSVWSAFTRGDDVFVSAVSPGFLVRSFAGCNRPVGYVVAGAAGAATHGINFVLNHSYGQFPSQSSNSFAIAAVTGSLHTFSCSVGRFGWNRETVMIGNSADHVELKLYSDAARTTLLYSTISGGVSVVGSFQDRAGYPWENTDASTLGDLVYGTLKVLSLAAVGSDTVGVRFKWDRHR